MSGILTAITDVWTSITEFILGLFTSVSDIFYNAETGLSFIGVLAVVLAGVSLLLLVWNLIRSFFVMRG